MSIASSTYNTFIFYPQNFLTEALGSVSCPFTPLLVLIFMLVYRALWIGQRALAKNMSFHGFLAYALAIWIGFQSAVNIGVATGALPTKGLTLPFVSSGGSSLIIMLATAALLLRIDFEVRLKGKHAISGGRND